MDWWVWVLIGLALWTGVAVLVAEYLHGMGERNRANVAERGETRMTYYGAGGDGPDE